MRTDFFIRSRQVASKVCLALLMISCSGGGAAIRDPDSVDDTESSITIEEFEDSTTSIVNVDPSAILTTIVEDSGADFSTGTFEHECGTYALIHGSGSPVMLAWGDDEWASAPVLGSEFEPDPELVIEDSWIEDLTGDGNPEVVISWFYEGANRTFGQVLSASSQDCEWRYLGLVYGCGIATSFDDLALAGGVAKGSGLVDCAYGRINTTFQYRSELDLFVAGPDQGERFCQSLSEDYDLPLSNCSEGWAVSMAQEELVASGIDVDTDGQFGPRTQIAVLEYQKRNDLPLTGEVDPLTWSTMYPADSGQDGEWSEFPDFDGDGISSPREIGHASGAFEYYEEPIPVEPKRRQRPVVVRTYCETRTTGLTSNMRGPLVDYVLVTEYSNGQRTYRTVGSSWSTLSGECG